MSTRLLPAVLVLAAILLHACGGHQKKPSTKQQSLRAEVNKDLERTPPIAAAIGIKTLKEPVNGNYVLLTATFDPEVLKAQAHAIVVNDETLVLHDDGADGDEKAEDGVFPLQ